MKTYLPKMYLIVGLGNPGKQFENTRHNVGYLVITDLAEEYNCDRTRQQHQGLTATFNLDGKKIMLCEPLTYMNLSGDCVASLARYYKIPDDKIIIIYDDVDLPLGEVRVRRRGGPGTHNGMKSVVYSLDSTDFPRIRVGTGPCPEHMDLIDFVLGHFTPEEEKIIQKAAKLAARAAILIVTEGVDAAMNEINGERVD